MANFYFWFLVFAKAYCLLVETTYMVQNAMQGSYSKTELSNSNLVIIIQFLMLAGLALTSNKEPLLRVHHAP